MNDPYVDKKADVGEYPMYSTTSACLSISLLPVQPASGRGNQRLRPEEYTLKNSELPKIRKNLWYLAQRHSNQILPIFPAFRAPLSGLRGSTNPDAIADVAKTNRLTRPGRDLFPRGTTRPPSKRFLQRYPKSLLTASHEGGILNTRLDALSAVRSWMTGVHASASQAVGDLYPEGMMPAKLQGQITLASNHSAVPLRSREDVNHQPGLNC